MKHYSTYDIKNGSVAIDESYNLNPDLSEDIARIFPALRRQESAENALECQQVDESQPKTEEPHHTYNVIVTPSNSETNRTQPLRRGRPPKPKSSRPKVDGRRKTMSGPITATQRRDVLDAFEFAAALDRSLDTAIDIQPAKLDAYPDGDIGQWFRDVPLKRLAGHLGRQKMDGQIVGWYAIAIRESYEGDRREHLHIVCHCPACLRPGLARMLRKAMPGDGVVDIKPLAWDRHPATGRKYPAGLEYRLKQQTGQAAGPPRPGRPRPETHSRHDGSPIAPVFGQRVILSRSINRQARTAAGWQAERDEWREKRRAYYRARRIEEADQPLPTYQPSQP